MSFIKIFKSVLITILSVQLFSSMAMAESPSYSVDGSNYMQHADKLTDGQMKAFENYADYRIDVYAASAECRLPDAVRAVSGSNSKMVNGNEGIWDSKVRLCGERTPSVASPSESHLRRRNTSAFLVKARC